MKEFRRTCRLMGSAFELCVVAKNESGANDLLQTGVDEIIRIENLLSEFKSDSETSRLNQEAAYGPLDIDKECFQLIERSNAISKLTNGCFDITVSPLKKLFSFKNEDFVLPSKEQIQETLRHIGFDKMILDTHRGSIRFTNKELGISFAAIGKGYASDRVKKIWLEQGVEAGYINASGDLSAFGKRSDGSDWRIGIANPDDKSEMLLFIPASNISVATSGDYEQFFMHEGIRYSHNINPHSGLPITGIKSVSIVSPSAELSDALATAVYVMGKELGIDFVNQLPQTHAIVVDDTNNLILSKDLEYEKISA